MRHPEQRVTESKDLGILMNMNLQKIKLGEVCRFINGRAYSQPELLDSGKYKVLRVGNIFEGNHWYYSDMELDDDKYCDEGDLLYSWACTFGPYIWHGPKTIYHYHIWKVEPNQSLVDKHFLYYFLNHQTKGFMGSTHGSTMIHITKENMENFEVLLPSLSDQKKIASVLSALDDKIALNKKMNQKLEAMAKRLYDYWFVQYDFPDKNGYPYKTTGGPMTYNPTLKREIPVGWEVKQICDITKIFNGSTPSTTEEENYGGEIVWITPKDLSDQNCKFVYQGARNITQAGYDSCSTTMVPKGTVVMSSRAPIGLLSIAQCDLCTNQGFKNMVPNDMTDSKYLYYTIQQHIPQIQNLGTGTTFKEVSKDELGRFAILYPPKKLIATFEEKVAPIFDVQFNKVKEISRLTALRDKLLPLLMNGQVVVG